jgi:hypothetical protein
MDRSPQAFEKPETESDEERGEMFKVLREVRDESNDTLTTRIKQEDQSEANKQGESRTQTSSKQAELPSAS